MTKRLDKRIPLATPTMHGEELRYVNEAFDTNWIAPLGPNVDELEKAFSDYLDIEGTAAVSSGTAGLHLSYKLAGVGKDDIVIVQDLTFSATVNPIIYQNAIPVFVDSEYDTWNMDPKALELALKKYGERVKAVVLVHLYGTPAKLEEIMKLCDEYNVTLIEDAAESLSATYKGKQTGTFGKYGVISFNGNKIITTSGGGMVLCKSKEDAEKVKFWSTQSKDPAPWYQHSEIGYNYRMSNVCAGIGRGQFEHLEEHKEIKTKIFNKYNLSFRGLPLLMNPYEMMTVPNFWLSCILIEKDAITDGFDAEKLRIRLDELNIESRRIWKPMHLQPVFEKYDYIKVKSHSVSEDIFERGLCLPSDLKMTEEEQEIVIENIKEIFNS